MINKLFDFRRLCYLFHIVLRVPKTNNTESSKLVAIHHLNMDLIVRLHDE